MWNMTSSIGVLDVTAVLIVSGPWYILHFVSVGKEPDILLMVKYAD